MTFLILYLVGVIILLLILFHFFERKLDEYEKIISDVIDFMNYKSYDEFCEYSHLSNGKSRYKNYEFFSSDKKIKKSIEYKNTSPEGL